MNLRTHEGRIAAPGDAWWGAAEAADHDVLRRAVGPVLDVGCGPGRHLVALGELGVPALGIDVTSCALTSARRRGALVLERSVFERVPGAGRWSSALLLDGNLGIGGEPVVLLRRVMGLLRHRGRLIVEVGAPGSRLPVRAVQLEIGGIRGPWFQWAHVAADELHALAASAALTVRECWSVGARWFAVLVAHGR